MLVNVYYLVWAQMKRKPEPLGTPRNPRYVLLLRLVNIFSLSRQDMFDSLLPLVDVFSFSRRFCSRFFHSVDAGRTAVVLCPMQIRGISSAYLLVILYSIHVIHGVDFSVESCDVYYFTAKGNIKVSSLIFVLQQL